MKIRLQGAALLAICVFAFLRLSALAHALPGHKGTLPDLALAMVVVVTGVAGAAMTVVGPALFRPYEWPPRRGD